MDDHLIAAGGMNVAQSKTQRMDKITDHANISNKGWDFSGEADPSGVVIGGEHVESKNVMGLLWTASSDTFGFRVVLKFKEGEVEVVVSYVEDFDCIVLTLVLTYQLLLANVARIFDQAGLLCPNILLAKLLMRKTWCGRLLVEMILFQTKFPRSGWCSIARFLSWKT